MKTNAMRKESDCVQTIHAGHIDLHVKVALWRVDDWDDKVETTWKETVHPPFATTSSPIDFLSHHLSEAAIGKKTMKGIDERIDVFLSSPLFLLQIKALTKFTSIRKLMETILSPIMIHYTA